MTTSPRGSDDLVVGQAIPESTFNEDIRHTEAGACHFPVVDKDLTAPPGACTDGANYIIAATAAGLWASKETQIATALGTNAANGWRYHVPIEGFTAYLQDENLRYLYDGSAWVIDTSGGSYTDEQARDAIGTALVEGPGIKITVDDGADTITLEAQGPAPSTQSGTSYTAVLADANTYIQFTNGAAVAFTIPPNASVAFEIGTVIAIEQNGAGVVTFTAGAGVTLNSRGGLVATAGQYAVAQAKKVATNTWVII